MVKTKQTFSLKDDPDIILRKDYINATLPFDFCFLYVKPDKVINVRNNRELVDMFGKYERVGDEELNTITAWEPGNKEMYLIMDSDSGAHSIANLAFNAVYRSLSWMEVPLVEQTHELYAYAISFLTGTITEDILDFRKGVKK